MKEKLKIQKAKVVDRAKIGLTEYWIVNIPEYCGKILHQRKGTSCPLHYHKKKHETFLIWKGKVKMKAGGEEFIMKPGDILVLEREIPHTFTALEEDAIIFEFSGEHREEDCYFLDPAEQKKAVEEAKVIEDYKWPFP